MATHDLSHVEAARWYWSQGLVPIPWVPRDGKKVAAVKDFTYAGYVGAARQFIERVLERWESEPEWRVGVALAETGRWLVLDVDSLEQLEAFEAEHGELPSGAWIQESGREGGGRHYLWRRPASLGEWPRQGPLSSHYPQLEVKSNGFIAVAPSLHPSGRAYRWVSGGAEPAELGWGFTAYLAQRQLTGVMSGNGENGSGLSLSGSSTYTNPDVDHLLEHGVPSGAPQDDVLRDLVWKLVSRGDSDAQVRLTWRAVVARTPLTRPHEPWTDADLARHLRGAREKLGRGVVTAGEREWAAGLAAPTPTAAVPAQDDERAEPVVASADEGGGDGGNGDDPRLGPVFFEDLTPHTRDQAGMAELLVERVGSELTWDPAVSRFTVWDAALGCWREDGRRHEEVWRLARRLGLAVDRACEEHILSHPEWLNAAAGEATGATARQQAEALRRMEQTRAWARIFANAGLNGVVAAVAPQVSAVSDRDFDRDDHLLNLANGTLDVRTGELRPHDHADRLRHRVPIAYRADLAMKPLNEVAPHFAGLIRRMCAAPGEVSAAVESARRLAVARWLGYQLHGSNPEKKLAVLEGASNIGKNQVLEVVCELLGEGLAWPSARPQLLVRSARDRPETEEAKLRGRRLVVVNELTEDQVLDEGQVLRLVNPGGTAIEVKKLYADPITVLTTWKITVTTNELPKARLTDPVVNRLHLLPLSQVSVPRGEWYDVKAAVLAEEREAVLAHLVRWWREWWLDWESPARAGLLTPEESRSAIATYRGHNLHPAERFIEERLDLGDPDAHLEAAVLWEYCDAYYRRQHPDTDRKFTGGRRKLFDLVSKLPGVERVERPRGTRSPLLLGFRGVRVLTEADVDLRLLSERGSARGGG